MFFLSLHCNLIKQSFHRAVEKKNPSPPHDQQMHRRFISAVHSLNPLYSTLPRPTPSLFSTSSLQSSTPSLPLPVPLRSFLFDPQNPNQIDLICSHLKHSPATSLSQPHLRLGNSDVSKILLRCQSDPLKALDFFNWSKTHLGLRPTTQNYCVVVHILAWAKKSSQAIETLFELVENRELIGSKDDVFQGLLSAGEFGCNFDPSVFGMLIKVYLRLGFVEEGFEAFQRTVGVGLAPDTRTCNTLLNGLSKVGSFELCWEVYDAMERARVLPNSVTFNVLMKVICKSGDAGKAKAFMEDMEEKGFEPDVFTYNTLIAGYCRKGRLEEAFYLFRIMGLRGVEADSVSYRILVHGLCKDGRVKDAHQLFNQMVQLGFGADNFMYELLISGYCEEGRLREAKSLLEEMIQNGLVPSKIGCGVIVDSHIKRGQLLSCLNYIVRLRRVGVPLSAGIYRSLIKALCEENRPNAGKSVFDWMLEDGLEPDLEVYNAGRGFM
ncbi:Pentatricopeptide repeat-containing protein [Acorus calamus]|uniref:Pentatricopeptide repeat-containing protein n=1 Tax=Acorus calamus TaxID=4465 RepID=A0AAV9DCX2_ACOCL|nr:Pentatricopeptide repeat-containing protein [Acorus calamus]